MRHRMLILACGLALAGLWAVPASANVLVRIDKSTQQMSVYVDGNLSWQWRVSTGVPGRDTPSGTFHAFRMEAEHFSKEFDDAPMPHSIFFTKIGHAIHGYLDTRRLGTPASHGCVRLDPANATKLYALVEEQGVLNTTVVVTGDVQIALARRPPSGEASVESVSAPSYGYGYGYRDDRAYGYRGDRSYGYRDVRAYSSRDERYAPYGAQQPADPSPPPGYPPFPRPWR